MQPGVGITVLIVVSCYGYQHWPDRTLGSYVDIFFTNVHNECSKMAGSVQA